MKKSELKNIIKECVREMMFEGGVLSNLVKEVALGINAANNKLLEQTISTPRIDIQTEDEARNRKEKERKRLLETKKKMLDAIGTDRMKGVFEGTKPLSNSGTPTHSPLGDKDPSDAGVDISALFGASGQKWQKLK